MTKEAKHSIHELYNIQDEINIKTQKKELQEELTHTIAIILHCIEIQSTDPLHYKIQIPIAKYMAIKPTSLSNYLFQPAIQQEIHNKLVQQIQTNQIQNREDFIEQLFQQIFHSPRIPILFQETHTYQTLERYLEPLYEIYTTMF